MPWIQLSFDLLTAPVSQGLSDAERMEELSELLESQGAVSISATQANASTNSEDPAASGSAILEPAPGSQPLWSNLRLTALFPLQTELGELQQRLDAYFADTGLPQLHLSFVEDKDWSETWREGLEEMNFGGRLRLLPKNLRDTARSDIEAERSDSSGAESAGFPQAVLYLDPGLAFGSGAHPTTRLCLEWLAQEASEVLAGARVTDYGCGSGILALAALALGAEHVTAIDYDKQALLATRENADFNGVDSSRIRLSLPPDSTLLSQQHAGRNEVRDAIEKPVDVLLANILANPLMELAPNLTQRVKPGGKLVLSGILEQQIKEVIACYPSFTFASARCLEGWACLVATRHHG